MYEDTSSAMLLYMENSKLVTYVTEKLGKGARPEEIKQQLLTVGWSEEEVSDALMQGLLSSGVPAPDQTRSVGTRKASTVEVVLNFFSFILLGGIATALIILYYQIINYYFPDSLQNSYNTLASTSSIHYSIAILLVGFPIYVASVKIWFRRYREDEAKVESKLTKWLTYLVLLIAAVTIVGDLITALFYFLQGEITARFFLKALTILTVSGLVFGFYYLERRKIQYRENISRKTFYSFGYSVAVFILVGFVFGFMAGGSPQTERKRGFDDIRAQDLSSLANCIGSYAYDRKALPSSLADLSGTTQYAYCGDRTDPETGAQYTYRILTASETVGSIKQGKFELCANFALETTKDSIPRNQYTIPSEKWSLHSSGESCDTEIVTLDRPEGTNILKDSVVPMPQ